MEAKAKKEAERQRVVEEEERKRRMMEYLQRLRDEVLEKEAALLDRAEGSQIAESKCKEVATEDEEEQWPSKRASCLHSPLHGSILCRYERYPSIFITTSRYKN